VPLCRAGSKLQRSGWIQICSAPDGSSSISDKWAPKYNPCAFQCRCCMEPTDSKFIRKQKSVCNKVALRIASAVVQQPAPMKTPTQAQLLQQKGLKRTAAREAILQLLDDAGHPVTHQDIIKTVKGRTYLDRVTVYRTLETLYQKGLLHRIQGIDGTWRFCRHRYDSTGKCGGNHIHFMCSTCKQMSCLPEQPLPWVAAPAGAVIRSKQLVVHGFCAGCTSRHKAKTKLTRGEKPL
jgi:Fur family transcriptional regulator, ferric uptake regulator